MQSGSCDALAAAGNPTRRSTNMTPGLYVAGMWAIALLIVAGTFVAARRPRTARARRDIR
jgi:hypothetical protein